MYFYFWLKLRLIEVPKPVVTNGAIIKCDKSCALPPGVPIPDSGTFPEGLPGSLVVLPTNKTISNNQPIANIIDNKPMLNINPFQLSCQSKLNPMVMSASASATAAAVGVKMFVPVPCIPTIVSPWRSGSTSCKLCNFSLITIDSTLTCTMGGTIKITGSSTQDTKIN